MVEMGLVELGTVGWDPTASAVGYADRLLPQSGEAMTTLLNGFAKIELSETSQRLWGAGGCDSR